MKLRKLATLSVMLVPLLGCGNGGASMAEKAVTEELRDPDTAQFSREFVAPDGSLVCGLVNAKNSFGEYVGFRRFYSIPRLGYAMIEPQSEKLQPAFESAWKEERCKLAG